MGFYAPAQIVRDAREHGVTVRPPDINHSAWDCTLEPIGTGGEGGDEGGSDDGGGAWALRLGFRQIKGFRAADAAALTAARAGGGRFDGPQGLWRRAGLAPAALELLARADAFRSAGLDRRAAAWAVKGLGAAPLPLFAGLAETAPGAPASGETGAEPPVALPEMPIGEHVVHDYASLSLSLKRHPVALLRGRMAAAGFAPAARLAALPHGRRVSVAGLVLVRQRPGTAKGVIFVTLEDETGVANLVVLPPVFERWRRPLLAARLLGAHGRVERHGAVIHLRVERLEDLSAHLAALTTDPRFAGTPARADEVRRPAADQRDPGLPKARNFR
jgi:error-prone DNA polymerase